MNQHESTKITGLPVQFLQEKIRELRTALFFPFNNSILKIPTLIVTVVEADDEGHIWFVIPKPPQSIQEFEKEFPAKLDFFKKGKPFFIKAEGMATMMTYCEASGNDFIPDDIKQELINDRMVIIEVKLQVASYSEVMEKPSSNWIKNSGTQLLNWLLNPQHVNGEPQLIAIPIQAMHNRSKMGTKAYS